MAITTLALATTLAYGLGPSQSVNYDVQIQYDGMIPILGGNEGKAEVRLGVRVLGLAPGKSERRASQELTRAEIFFNEGKLPLSFEAIQDFLPKTTLDFTSRGQVVATDAKSRDLPVRLPGLDERRIPDLVFLTLEFPEEAPEVGESWTFERKFGEGPLKTTCKLVALENDEARVEIQVEQTYSVLEDSAMQVVSEPLDAVNEVKTTFTATGEVRFDTRRGVLRMMRQAGKAVSEVRSKSTGETTRRELKTSVLVART